MLKVMLSSEFSVCCQVGALRRHGGGRGSESAMAGEHPGLYIYTFTEPFKRADIV